MLSEGLKASEQSSPIAGQLLARAASLGNQDHRFDDFSPLKTRRSAVSVEHDSNAFSAALGANLETLARLNCDPPCADVKG